MSQAQVQRLIRAMEGLGKTVYVVRAHPDGTVDVLLTELGALAVAVDEDPWAAHERRVAAREAAVKVGRMPGRRR